VVRVRIVGTTATKAPTVFKCGCCVAKKCLQTVGVYNTPKKCRKLIPVHNFTLPSRDSGGCGQNYRKFDARGLCMVRTLLCGSVRVRSVG